MRVEVPVTPQERYVQVLDVLCWRDVIISYSFIVIIYCFNTMKKWGAGKDHSSGALIKVDPYSSCICPHGISSRSPEVLQQAGYGQNWWKSCWYWQSPSSNFLAIWVTKKVIIFFSIVVSWSFYLNVRGISLKQPLWVFVLGWVSFVCLVCNLYYLPCFFFFHLVTSSISTVKYRPAECLISYENKTPRELLWV